MSNTSTRTYQTRVAKETDESLTAYAALMGHVERSLFKEISSGKAAKDLKSSYLTAFRITARQFNSTRIKLEGKIASIQELGTQRIETKKQQIAALEKTIARLKNKEKIHQKKRRLAQLTWQLDGLEKAKQEKRVSLCFGTKKLFRAQFHQESNGYSNHEEWKKDWQQARSSEIFIVGSKDETSGNQAAKLQ